MIQNPEKAALPGRLTSAAVLVADGLGQRIQSNLRAGAQLPSEAEMATEFGVSRITIREALKILSGRGLVSIGRGRKAVVTQPDGAMFGAFLTSLLKSDPKCMFDLLQVRRSLEIQSVTLATRHASRAGLASIESALAAMYAAAVIVDGGDDTAEAVGNFNQADVRFHEAMALSGGNRVLTYLFEAMAASLLAAFETSQRGWRQDGKSIVAECRAHERILKSVAARDEKGAIEAMTAILNIAEANLKVAIGNA